MTVGPGTYEEDLNFLGKDIRVQSVEGASNTMLQGSGTGSVVQFSSGEPLSSTLDGFTIIGGIGELNVNGDTEGGGIRIVGSAATLISLVVRENQADYGGAIVAVDADLDLSASVLEANEAVYGGGLYARDSNSSLSHLSINGNAARTGGGIRIYDGNVVLLNSVVGENSATEGAGGADLRYCQDSSNLTNNTLAGNSGRSAGGVYLYATNARVENNIIYGSLAGVGLSGYGSTNHPTIAYNDVYANSDGDYSGTLVGSSSTNGNISSDPLFVIYSANGNYSDDYLALISGSPCMNTGNPDIQDPDGSRSDMGAYGGPDADSAVYEDDDQDGMADVWESMHLLDPTRDDSGEDLDQDGLSNLEEYRLGTAPESSDSDSDGVEDGDEVAAGSNPRDASDNVPVAQAGPDQVTDEGLMVLLDGSSSSDPNGDPIDFDWRFISVPASSTLVDANLADTESSSFSPDVAGTYVVGLVVSDGRVRSSEDSVSVRVRGTLRVPADYPTIQAAINAAGSGEVVRVSSGTYYESISFLGKDIIVTSTTVS